MTSIIKSGTMWAVETYSQSYTANGGTTAQVNFQPSKDGYIPIGVVGMSTGNPNVLIQQARNIGGGIYRAYPRNITSSAITATFTIDVLFLKA